MGEEEGVYPPRDLSGVGRIHEGPLEDLLVLRGGAVPGEIFRHPSLHDSFPGDAVVPVRPGCHPHRLHRSSQCLRQASEK